MQSAAMLIGSRKEKKTTETNIDGEVQAPWFRLRIPSFVPSSPRHTEDVIRYLRDQGITLTYDPATRTLHAGTGETAQTITLQAS
jgi:hypothetical protein